jgi:hypothetical protein
MEIAGFGRPQLRKNNAGSPRVFQRRAQAGARRPVKSVAFYWQNTKLR